MVAHFRTSDAICHRKAWANKPNCLKSNKVVRTPDSLITSETGGFVFAEYTTDQTNLGEKIKRDIEKCLDEAKTGVPLDQIERIIFCFNGRLNAAEEHEIRELCAKQGIVVDLISGDAISFDLSAKFPGIARDYLGVKIDSGQILSPSDFVVSYGKSKLAAPLDLKFHFREKELSDALSELEGNDLVLLSGRPGVGKSRLALEVCEQFSSKHPEYTVKCVFGRNRELWDDLAVWFGDAGSYLIFVDDANRISHFEYIVELLTSSREGRDIRVVATVRDYALKQVEDAAAPLGAARVIELPSFSNDEIKGLIKEEYGILNHRYLDRITDIAGGNPRLAVMSAIIAKRENTLSSIHDVTSLYDSYFSNILNELDSRSSISTQRLIQVSAIVSFLKAVDRSHEESMAVICDSFNIDQDVFWSVANELHDFEILDMYENEVVRVSDQVLGTYLFYLAVFGTGPMPWCIIRALLS